MAAQRDGGVGDVVETDGALELVETLGGVFGWRLREDVLGGGAELDDFHIVVVQIAFGHGAERGRCLSRVRLDQFWRDCVRLDRRGAKEQRRK